MDYITHEEMEALQAKAKWRHTIFTVAAAASIMVTAFLLIWVGNALPENVRDSRSAFQAALAIIAITVGWVSLLYYSVYHVAYKEFNKAFKRQYVVSTIQRTNWFDNIIYRMYGGLTHNEVYYARVVAAGDSVQFESEDMVSGTYKNIPFQYCEVTTKNEAGDRVRSNVQELFKGQMLLLASFDATKSSASHVQVFHHEFLRSNHSIDWIAPQRVETDNAIFNQQFVVCATSPHNAFYILTPKMMERILAFSQAASAPIGITFFGNAMAIAICNPINMFEGNIKIPIDQQKNRILQDVQLIKDAGDIFIEEQIILSAAQAPTS